MQKCSDIGRKLDAGIGILRDIKSDTSVIPDIKERIDHLNVSIGEYNRCIDGHNLHLENILKKMDEGIGSG